MLDMPARVLVLGGVVTLTLGLLLGFPLRKAVNEPMHDEVIRAWRVAHSSITAGGIMLFALVVPLQYLPLATAAKDITTALLLLSTTAFCYALIVGACKSHRGLMAGDDTTANSVFYANVTGALTLLCAMAFVLVGAIMLVLS